MESNFTERLRNAQSACGSMVCVGLDPDIAKLPDILRQKHAKPEAAILAFNSAIIQATAPYSCAYKLNAAFYENLGSGGFSTLASTIDLIPNHALCIVDAKRGDIGNTARSYASSIFNLLGADGCTVAPYMGFDAVRPFLEYRDRATFVLVRTSNPSSDEFQSLIADAKPLYEHVASQAAAWGGNIFWHCRIRGGGNQATGASTSTRTASDHPLPDPWRRRTRGVGKSSCTSSNLERPGSSE